MENGPNKNDIINVTYIYIASTENYGFSIAPIKWALSVALGTFIYSNIESACTTFSYRTLFVVYNVALLKRVKEGYYMNVGRNLMDF